jgi:hypothetical protein
MQGVLQLWGTHNIMSLRSDVSREREREEQQNNK